MKKAMNPKSCLPQVSKATKALHIAQEKSSYFDIAGINYPAAISVEKIALISSKDRAEMGQELSLSRFVCLFLVQSMISRNCIVCFYLL